MFDLIERLKERLARNHARAAVLWSSRDRDGSGSAEVDEEIARVERTIAIEERLLTLLIRDVRRTPP
jgi:hypothetical protein